MISTTTNNAMQTKPITDEQVATLKNCLMNVIDSKLDNQAKLRGILKHFDDYGVIVKNKALKEVDDINETYSDHLRTLWLNLLQKNK